MVCQLNSRHQKKIFHIDDLLKLKTKHQVEKLIIVNEDLGLKSKKQIIDKCLSYNIKVVTVPPFNKWIYGKLNLKQMKDLNIEDLLQREPIVINNTKISHDLEGKRILITGAAGSIGSEIVRQVMNYNPGLVILCDMAESALHDIQLEVEEFYPSSKIRIFIANVQNFHRMQHLFKEYSPEIIFHAAAYKHVPMMENNPSEAVMCNVLGTKTLADLALKPKPSDGFLKLVEFGMADMSAEALILKYREGTVPSGFMRSEISASSRFSIWSGLAVR